MTQQRDNTEEPNLYPVSDAQQEKNALIKQQDPLQPEKVQDQATLHEQTTEQVKRAQEMLNFQGSAHQVAQQHTLIVMSIEYLISAVIGLLIASFEPLAVVVNIIPFVDFVVIVFFAVSCLIVQFFPKSVENAPRNFFVFVAHAISKILLMVYFAIWLRGMKYGLYLILFTLIALYMLYTVKKAAGNGLEANLQVRNHYIWLTLYVGVISALLTVITWNSVFIGLFMFLGGLIYSFFILLALQRYTVHTYLQHDYNDVYLGSTQIDADLLVCCYVVAFHLSSKEKNQDLEGL